MTQKLMDFINTAGSRPGFSFEGVAETVLEGHYNNYYRVRKQYSLLQLRKLSEWQSRVGEASGDAAERLDQHREMRGQPPAQWGQRAEDSGRPREARRGEAAAMARFVKPARPRIEPFGAFTDPDGWNGRDPPVSGDLVRDRFVEEFNRRQQFLTTYLASTTGRVLCWDHTYELARKAKVNNRSVHPAVFSVLNEHNQVLGLKFVQSEEMDEASELLREVKQRLQVLGVNEIDAVYSDRCCQDKRLIMDLFPHLNRIGLDLFHAIQRLTKCISKRDKIFFAKTSGMLARCFTDVVKEDLDTLKRFIRTSDQEQHVKMREKVDWERTLETSRYARDKCRLAVCQPDEIKRRLKEVEAFMRKTDQDAEAKWREEVYTPWQEQCEECREEGEDMPPEPTPPRKKLTDEFLHAVKTLCDRHLECLQDPKPVEEMYYVRPGHRVTGLPQYGCLRGSSQQEGLHSYLESLVMASHTSEELMHSVIVSGCVRWNEKMRITHRGVGEEMPLNTIYLDVVHDINAIEEELFGEGEAFHGRLPVPAIVPGLPHQNWALDISFREAEAMAPPQRAVRSILGRAGELLRSHAEHILGATGVDEVEEVFGESRDAADDLDPRDGGRLGRLSQGTNPAGDCAGPRTRLDAASAGRDAPLRTSSDALRGTADALGRGERGA